MVFDREIKISAKGFCDVHNITDEIQKAVQESGIKNGILVVTAIGSTTGITTLEYEPYLVEDFKEFMEELYSSSRPTRHGKAWGDDNGFSHLRSAFIGTSKSFSISDGRIDLGTWQQIVFCDFDNRSRERVIKIKILGE